MIQFQEFVFWSQRSLYIGKGFSFIKSILKKKRRLFFVKVRQLEIGQYFFFIYGLVVMLLFFGLNIYVDIFRVKVYLEQIEIDKEIEIDIC